MKVHYQKKRHDKQCQNTHNESDRWSVDTEGNGRKVVLKEIMARNILDSI